MYKTVLVPVDLSHIEKGSKMIERAKYLADTNNSQLTLLNVIPEIPSYVAIELPSDLHEKAVENAEADLRVCPKTLSLIAKFSYHQTN